MVYFIKGRSAGNESSLTIVKAHELQQLADHPDSRQYSYIWSHDLAVSTRAVYIGEWWNGWKLWQLNQFVIIQCHKDLEAISVKKFLSSTINNSFTKWFVRIKALLLAQSIVRNDGESKSQFNRVWRMNSFFLFYLLYMNLHAVMGISTSQIVKSQAV